MATGQIKPGSGTISIHALLAESDQYLSGVMTFGPGISIHALLAESDTSRLHKILSDWGFLSTLSLRRATVGIPNTNTSKKISIHALLAESDFWTTPTSYGAFLSTLSLRRATWVGPVRNLPKRYFYPRSPCGERLYTDEGWPNFSAFLSTLSLRRATAKVHKTVGHFCAYETNFMGIASSC